MIVADIKTTNEIAQDISDMMREMGFNAPEIGEHEFYPKLHAFVKHFYDKWKANES